MPVLFLEVNGGTHLTIPGKVIMDSFKLALSQSKSIPLIRIPLYKSYTEEEIHAMLQQALSEINIRKALPAYCPQCGNRLKTLTNKQTKAYFYICNKCKSADEDSYSGTIKNNNADNLMKDFLLNTTLIKGNFQIFFDVICRLCHDPYTNV